MQTYLLSIGSGSRRSVVRGHVRGRLLGVVDGGRRSRLRRGRVRGGSGLLLGHLLVVGVVGELGRLALLRGGHLAVGPVVRGLGAGVDGGRLVDGGLGRGLLDVGGAGRHLGVGARVQDAGVGHDGERRKGGSELHVDVVFALKR